MPELTKDSTIAKFLPATLIPDTRMSDDLLETYAIRALDSEQIRCERTEDGRLRMFPPLPGAIWLMIRKLHSELEGWSAGKGNPGCAVFRRRFFLGDSLMMCPDVALVAAPTMKKRFEITCARVLKTCPSFVVEFCSRPKELRPLKEKMFHWIAIGAELGWLFVPHEECVFVYLPGEDPEVIDGDFIVGRGRMEKFFVHLDDVWKLDAYRRQHQC
jgi:Putative restriction endonuclease